jgi:3-hydroxy-3-methylglutaryl CoA synthase
MIGITGYGGYVPRLRLSREAVGLANAWYAPHLMGRKGTRAMASWDEDSITMAVAAARNCLGASDDRSHVRTVILASNTLPFAERLNCAVVAAALTLPDEVNALDMGGAHRVGLSAMVQALSCVQAGHGNALVLASDLRQTRPASTQELDYGDGAAAMLLGSENVLAEWIGSGVVSVDFIDHFRATGQDMDYHWEERWVKDEGIAKLMPQAITAALAQAQLQASDVDHFIFPCVFPKMDVQLARSCGIAPEAVVSNLSSAVGDTGAAHALLMLAHTLESAQPGQTILVSQFGSGAQAMLFRVTCAISAFRPARSVSQWLAQGVLEHQYTKFLSYRGQLQVERGMRGEQDKKTALSTAWRHHKATLGLVGGQCSVTGSVHFPPSRLSYDQGKPLQDTQQPYKLADRPAKILSWSAEYLSWHPSPPHHYGQIDFEGGGRILMDFTDLEVGQVHTGTPMEMVFRIKDTDDRRGFTRYFWKATPVRDSVPLTEGNAS